MIRMYLSTVALFNDEETAQEWARTQAIIFRKDPDVVDVEARLVVDNEMLVPMARLVEI